MVGAERRISVARAGKPQLSLLLLLDQPYWGYRVQVLGVGPERVKIAKVSESELEQKMGDLISNPEYKKNAAMLSEQIESEKGIENICNYIESLAR